jgi:hypothetical protein
VLSNNPQRNIYFTVACLDSCLSVQLSSEKGASNREGIPTCAGPSFHVAHSQVFPFFADNGSGLQSGMPDIYRCNTLWPTDEQSLDRASQGLGPVSLWVIWWSENAYPRRETQNEVKNNKEGRVLDLFAARKTDTCCKVKQPSKKKICGFPLQAWNCSWGSRRLRLLDLLDFRHFEGGKVVTFTHRPPSPPGVSWYSFLEAESTPGHMVPSVASEKIPSDTTGDRSRELPTSSAVP